jgi:hypothetical protein
MSAPGKSTRTHELTLQNPALSAPPGTTAAVSPDNLGEAPSGTAAVQRKGAGAEDASMVHRAAAEGVSGSAQALPHLDRIQATFGSHDVSGIRAHVGGPATAASEAMGASAYATGNAVAFAQAPDLHTAAHEAAHVVQQRGGVQLKGGVDEAGDSYERHADAVADAVVSGRSAVPLLDSVSAAGGQAAAASVQHSTGGQATGAPRPCSARRSTRSARNIRSRMTRRPYGRRSWVA